VRDDIVESYWKGKDFHKTGIWEQINNYLLLEKGLICIVN